MEIISKPKFLIKILFLSLFFLLLPFQSSAKETTHIQQIKKLYINTVLVTKGDAHAAIVTPRSNQYRESANAIRDKIKDITGIIVPCYKDDAVPKDILKKYNVIALGNMNTNTFIEKLYHQWYCLLDLKYPGKNGYVVRSLHNPYGTGHNVIFIGGSDDEGVEKAARVFADLLKPGDPLQVGRLMEIKLGKGINPPEIGDDIPDWVVYSWRDSWRRTKGGRTTGYKPSTFFGWNPISIAGALYYMTGQRKYLDYFKVMAMPDPDHISLPNRTSEAFNDPLDPLVKNYHYRSHLVDCVYDLIEESPLFTNEERLFITNKLLEHQHEYDPSNTYSKPNGSRHALWHMMNIYTGSRYFAKYYPDPVWNRRIDNIRTAFNSFINNPTWGERDTLSWVSTSIEPVFDFFMMDGFESFVESGTAKTMMTALEILMTGNEIDDYNKCVPISLLHKAACMLKDTRYIWMAWQLGFDFDTFRIGQSYCPADDLPVAPPTDLVNKIAVYPLAKTYWKQTKKSISLKEGFQILSYRSGLSNKNDYFLVDGFCGLGRNYYHLNTILRLHMFNGRTMLRGYANDVDILFNGKADPNVARCAALKNSFSKEDIAFIKTEVSNMTSSKWQRYILYLKDSVFIVIDKIIPQKDGIFDISCSWQLGGKVKKNSRPSRSILTASGTRLCSADIPIKKNKGNLAQEKFSGHLQKSNPFIIANILTTSKNLKAISKIEDGAYLITGMKRAFVGAGNFSSDIFSVAADFIYFDKDKIFLSNAKTFVLNNKVIAESDKPATFFWNIKENNFTIETSQLCYLSLATTGNAIPFELTKGKHYFAHVKSEPDLVDEITNALDELKTKIKATKIKIPERKEIQVNWLPEWRLNLKGKITHVAVSDISQTKSIWAATKGKKSSKILKISPNGVVLKTIECNSEILSVWSAKDKKQADAFALLVGFKDDTLRALSEDGKELWSFKAKIHTSFKIGDRYDCPWFSDPGPPYNMTGVHSIFVDDLWSKGKQEIVIGRPCTVEFHTLYGDLIRRVPTRSGTNTSLAALKKRGSLNKEKMLLAGKYFTGNPKITGIDCDYKNVSDRLFSGVVPGYASMHAWLQRGLNHLVVEDLNNDGTDEVIYNLSGHWNELRLYDGGTDKPLWAKYFGHGKRKTGSMRGIEVVDLNGDGLKEIIVAVKSGWVYAFDYKGRQLWQHHFESGVKCMDAIDTAGKLVVGLEDGCIFLLDGKGNIERNGKLESSIQIVLCNNHAVFVGSERGVLEKSCIN